MLRLVIPISPEGWDEAKQEFVEPQVVILELEHSLVAVHNWESKWHKAFLSKRDKTEEETLDYIKYMTLTPGVDPEVYNRLTSENVKQINDYISDPMTATYFPQDQGNKNSREVVTSELIYYWMLSLQIPVEFQHWHLNQLLTLIKVCNIKNAPPKKRSGRQLIQDYAAMNAARKKEWNSKG